MRSGRTGQRPNFEENQAAACTLLLAPHLAPWNVALQVGLSPRPAGQSDLERQRFAAVWTSAAAQRSGIKLKRDLQGRLGRARPRKRPGPKSGSRNRTSPARLAFQLTPSYA